MLTQWVVPAITITGRTDKVKIATFNGTPFAIGMVQEGKIEVDVGENLDWIGHAVVDSEMRMLCGLPTVKDPKIPLLIFDKDNADTAGKPPKVNTGYGDAYIEGYAQAVEAALSRVDEAEGPRAPSPSRIFWFFRSSGLSKSFGGARALDEVSLDGPLWRSAWPARAEWVGEIDPDQNPVRVSRRGRFGPHSHRWARGRPAGRTRRSCASTASAFVHQHLGLMPSLTVLENLLLPDLAVENRWLVDWRAEARASARAVQAI